MASRSHLKFFLGALLIGLAWGNKSAFQKLFSSSQQPSKIPITTTSRAENVGPVSIPDNLSLRPPPRTYRGHTYPWIRARQLKIMNQNSHSSIQMSGTEDGSGLWMSDSNNSASLQAGVHSNGFPFLLVSDKNVYNFGLGRVDGRKASPILVFRSNNIVKMVLGLSMTDAGQPPFWAYYSSSGEKTDYIGSYCDNPDRVCSQ